MSFLPIKRISKAHIYASLFSCTLVIGLLYSGAIDFVTERSIRPLEFQIRSQLNKDPALDPRLRIYSYDDTTLRWKKDIDLDIQLWLDLFQGLGEAHPKKIMIDKIFGIVKGEMPPTEIVSRLKNLPVPIITGAFSVPNSIRLQSPIPANFKDLELKRWAAPEVLASGLSWLPVKPGYVYGPYTELLDGFSSFGHIQYHKQGQVDAFVRYDPSHAVPHWSLQAAEKIALKEDGLEIDGRFLQPVEGRLAVNMIDPSELRKSIYSMDSIIKRAMLHKDFSSQINENSYVVLLPNMSTGSTDMVETPVGTVPGAYVVISMLNSVLTGQWISTIPDSVPIILLFSLLGSLFAIRFHMLKSFSAFAAVLLSLVLVGFAGFCWFSLQLPWVSCSLAFGLSGFINMGLIIVERERRSQRIIQAISGLVPMEHLNALLKKHEKLQFDPLGQVVSIMFVDIVGFSLTTKKLSPGETFSQLRELLNDITQIVHKYQGTIDKTLGDGLLCFFGYNILGEKHTNHADLAVRCAMDIQRSIFQRNCTAGEQGKAIYPLRIGINSSSVYIGNIGNSKRFDFTMVGDGVNFAARLETACAPFKIMIGPGTKAQLIDFSPLNPAMQKRYVMVKHTSELLEAWQVDPFHETGEAVARLEKLYWTYAGIQQRENRYQVPDFNLVKIHSSIGNFNLMNYSLSGFGLKGDVFLAHGVVFNLTLDSIDHNVSKVLGTWGLSSLIVEVCWGSQNQSAFEHGVRFIGLNIEQKNRIFELLHQKLSAALSQSSSY